MARVLEPEVMDEPEQAAAYARADFAAVNGGFADEVRRCFPAGGLCVDLGCGPADIPLRLAAASPALRVVAVDASLPMLRLGREAARRHASAGRVRLVAARLPDLPFADRVFDLVVSNSLVHHLPDALPFWSAVRRLARPGAAVVVMDLLRPGSPEEAARLVETHAAGEPAVLRRDFHASLLAAFTLDEVRGQLEAAGLGRCECAAVDDRHWLVRGTV